MRTIPLTLFLILVGIECAAPSPPVQKEKETVVYTPEKKLEVKPVDEIKGRAGVYKVGRRDLLEIRVWNHPDLSGDVRVNEDGEIKLPLIGVIKVLGLTTEEIVNLLETRYSDYIKNPQINVVVKEYAAKTVYLLGEVKAPGVYPLFQSTMLVQLLTQAGGFLPTALLEGTYLIRGGKVYNVNLRSILYEGKIDEDVVLEDGDIVFVPGTNFMKIYVLGAVRNPGEVMMTKKYMSVIEAISSAGGIEIGGLEDDVKIIRDWPNSPEMHSVNLREILKGDFTNSSATLLRPGDIVFVPKSKLKSINEVLQLIQPIISTFISTPLGILVDSLYVRERLR